MTTLTTASQPAEPAREAGPRVARPIYALRLARTDADVRAAQALRFQVFNLELSEGLATAYATGLDADRFDPACAHLLVEERQTGQLAGTYRLQTGRQAAHHAGFYSAQEFDLGPFEPWRNEVLELGRACVHRDHRNLGVLNLLWRGIAAFARENGCRYLTGCSSAPTTDPVAGARLYSDLMRHHLASPPWLTRPMAGCECPLDRLANEPVKVPRLLAAYLAVGAKICGPPALDPEFNTIDFLTWLDLQALPPRVAERFFAS